MADKGIYISEANHAFITELAKEEGRSRAKQLDIELSKLSKAYYARKQANVS